LDNSGQKVDRSAAAGPGASLFKWRPVVLATLSGHEPQARRSARAEAIAAACRTWGPGTGLIPTTSPFGRPNRDQRGPTVFDLRPGRQMNGCFGDGSGDLCHVRGIGSAASTAPSRIFSGRSGRPAPSAPLGVGSCCPAASSEGAPPVHHPTVAWGYSRSGQFRRVAETASGADAENVIGRGAPGPPRRPFQPTAR
jgi:hypothetical protein